MGGRVAAAGWLGSPVEPVASETLQRTAAEGIAEVTDGAPEGSGAAAVASLRAQVVAPTRSPGRPDAPAALAFAAYALGFLSPGVEATVATSGPWTRLTTPAGHALTRS